MTEYRAARSRLVDLNHVITAGMTTHPGLPGPAISAHLTREDSRARYAPGVEFSVERITMVGNTGTYVDSPHHRYAGGADLSDLPLESVADLPILVVRPFGPGGAVGGGAAGAGPGRAVDAAAFAGSDLAGAAVLVYTGWDRHWATGQYGRDAPYLTGAAATLLAEAGVRLVGIDSVNVDDIQTGGERPVHSVLLAAGIAVLEHLTCLGELPVTGARLHAAPPRVRGMGSFPVRAYAVVPTDLDEFGEPSIG